ncbi:MAG: hypothetical protein GF398_03400 [Chitinivibrionales bacterium]|nr:hypothetical protein [Chitinivibrionales bacterium]
MMYCSALDNNWHILDVGSPLYWDNEQRVYQHPTAYSDSAAHYIQSIGYNVNDRQWLYNLSPQVDTGVGLDIVSYPRGTPLWMGKPEGPYTIYGVTEYKEDIVAWGAFFEVGYFSAEFTAGTVSDSFYGGFLWDRAYHRVYFNDSAKGTGAEDGIVPSYSYIGIQQHEFVLMIAQNEKPPNCPVNPPVEFLHQGRINFPLTNESYVFDDFTYEDVSYVDTLGLQPNRQKIAGSYQLGDVYLEGTIFKFWPEQWWVYKGTYWDSTLHYSWGRGYWQWNGYITKGSDTIRVVNSFGGGEFTRHELRSQDARRVKLSRMPPGMHFKVRYDRNAKTLHISNAISPGSRRTYSIFDSRGRLLTASIITGASSVCSIDAQRLGADKMVFVQLKSQNEIVSRVVPIMH